MTQQAIDDPVSPTVTVYTFDVETYLKRGTLPPSRDKYADNKFNQQASDDTPYTRIVPDSREPQCVGVAWAGVELPSTSVVITYTDEARSTLWRTIYSVVRQTPKELLKEIILVDDFSHDCEFF